ncbi:MAG: hypothetical protein DRP74_09210 [Candidatus Omnitrophota bacterium]|nr:MAG: hypothetical protein DRP74_09210 [Candidatus Omnitrophota bacterium]
MVVSNTSIRSLIPRKSKPVLYTYPIWKRISFSIISEIHVEELKKYLWVETIDENALPIVYLMSNPVIVIHPYFYPMQKYERQLAVRFQRARAVIGIDVADSNHITPYAVRLTEYASAMIVPSTYAKNAYVSSGVKRPVYVVPHGVYQDWIDSPKRNLSTFIPIVHLKERMGYIAIMSWITHSGYRKGLDILLNLYNRLVEEYRNIMLILRVGEGVGYFLTKTDFQEGDIKPYFDGFIEKVWLTEEEKMELFDMADMFVLSSRGGGFEHPALEALTRLTPVIASDKGSWTDYLPSWSLVESRRSGQVLEGNPIHDGYGSEMIIEKAVDRTINILNNLDEYREKTRLHIAHVIKPRFTWEHIGKKLKDVIQKYMEG